MTRFAATDLHLTIGINFDRSMLADWVGGAVGFPVKDTV